LQSAIKDKDEYPVAKILISLTAYNHLFNGSAPSNAKVQNVTRKLRNISNNQEIKCKKIEFKPLLLSKRTAASKDDIMVERGTVILRKYPIRGSGSWSRR
jgi:hypothetical protein